MSDVADQPEYNIAGILPTMVVTPCKLAAAAAAQEMQLSNAKKQKTLASLDQDP